MQLTDIPAKFNIPFASSAGGGFIRTIPQSPTGVPGQAALTTGFPPENFEPVAAGGVPPFGQDFNGLLNQSTAWNRWQSAGVAFPPYDPTFQTAIGGYPKSAIVASLVEALLLYYSLVDNNVTNPDTGGAGWLIWSRKLTVNTTIYVNGSSGNDLNAGLTPATAKKTIQAAVTTAFTYPPSQFTITIQITAGTYPEAVSTPSFSGPPLIINGAGATQTFVTGANNLNTFSLTNANTATIQNLCVSTGTGLGPPCGFAAENGATLLTNNTASSTCAFSVWESFGPAFCTAGTHTFNAGGSSAALFSAFFGGFMGLTASAVFTFGGAYTLTSAAAANVSSNGSIEVPNPGVPTFVNVGGVTGSKYLAIFNGTIITQGQGISYFPGSVAGTTGTGGQYQ